MYKHTFLLQSTNLLDILVYLPSDCERNIWSLDCPLVCGADCCVSNPCPHTPVVLVVVGSSIKLHSNQPTLLSQSHLYLSWNNNNHSPYQFSTLSENVWGCNYFRFQRWKPEACPEIDHRWPLPWWPWPLLWSPPSFPLFFQTPTTLLPLPWSKAPSYPKQQRCVHINEIPVFQPCCLLKKQILLFIFSLILPNIITISSFSFSTLVTSLLVFFGVLFWW